MSFSLASLSLSEKERETKFSSSLRRPAPLKGGKKQKSKKKKLQLTERHLRDPVPRHPRLVVKDPPKVVPVREHVRLPRQVRPARVDDVEARVDPERGRDLLQPEVLLDCDGIVGAALDGGVVGRDGDELAGDAAEAGDDAAAGHGLRG